MRDPDDDLPGIDLSAWEAPPPPAGLADAVLARLAEPDAAAAVEPATRARGRWLATGAIAAVAAAAVAIAILGRTRRPATGHGDVVSAPAGFFANTEERLQQLEQQVAELEAENRALQQARTPAPAVAPAPTPSLAPASHASATRPPTAVERQALFAAIDKVRSALRACTEKGVPAGKLYLVFAISRQGRPKANTVDFIGVEGHLPMGMINDIEATPQLEARDPATRCAASVLVRLALGARFAGIRVTYPIARGEPAAPPCDAVALRETGIQAQATGDAAKATEDFEASLKCHFDPYVNKLAFMSACNASDPAAAARFFRRLRPSDQTSLIQMCVRNGIGYSDLVAAGRSPAPVATKGYLSIACKPPAKIWIDGADTHRTTPVTKLALTPGKHEVTFVLGEDRFTYPVHIEAGKTAKLTKDLE